MPTTQMEWVKSVSHRVDVIMLPLKLLEPNYTESEGQAMQSSSVTEIKLYDLCGSLLAQLQTNMVGQSAVQVAVETVLNNIPSELCETVERCFPSVENPLIKFNTLAIRQIF